VCQLLQKRKRLEQCCHDENAAIAILDVGRMFNGVEQQAYCVDKMCHFLPLIFLPASYPCGSMHAPFFCAFDALAVDDGGGRTGFPLPSFATLLIKRLVNSPQSAVIGP
jgi:hypothetical protein